MSIPHFSRRKFTVLAAAALCFPGISWAEKKPLIHEHDALSGETNYRLTIAKEYPHLKTCCYNFNGSIITGIFRDDERQRILVVDPRAAEEINLIRNGRVVHVQPRDAATIQIAGILIDGAKTVSQFDKPKSHIIGYWIDLKKTETFQIDMSFEWPSKCQYSASYDPDRGWRSALTKPISLKKDELVRADAYEIMDGSLAERVVEVLQKKETCLVRLKQWGDLKVARLNNQKLKDVLPAFVSVGKQITMNLGGAAEQLNKWELRQRMEIFTTAARLSDEPAAVVIRVLPDANDHHFRDILGECARFAVSTIYLVETKMPAKGARIPLLNNEN